MSKFCWQNVSDGANAQRDMKIKISKFNGGEPETFTNYGQLNKGGRGRGLASVGDALAQVAPVQVVAGVDWGAGRPLWRRELVAAWYRGERDALGLIEAAANEQAQLDLKLVENCVRAIVSKLADNGRKVERPRRAAVTVKDNSGRDCVRVRVAGGEEWQRAVSAGIAAIVQWRNGALASPVVPGSRVVEAVAVVAWRGVSDELSHDAFGHSVELSSVSDEWLAGAVEPLAVACCVGIESRGDKAARWLRERGAARRKQVLPARLDTLRHGNSRRAALVDRIEAAAARLLGGDSIDAAARSVGFKDRMHGGSIKEAAGVQLARAARACGLVFNLLQPHGTTAADEFNPYHRPLAIALN